MADQSFFDEATIISQVKAEIVRKYFWAWAKVMLPHVQRQGNRMAYIDLFAGPGRYGDGMKSTPLLILETAIRDEKMRDRLVTLFNDVKPENTSSLSKAIGEVEGVDTLHYKPVIMNEEVGTQIVAMFERPDLMPTLFHQGELIPTFFFVDPWGYKGLSLKLINSVLKNWGCDCIFFFNYNRVNMGITNSFVEEPINSLLGKTTADELRENISALAPGEREIAVIEAISQALKAMGGEFVLPFRFTNEAGSRTSHHLIFVSKNVLGYDIMKQIMAKESCHDDDGFASFDYNPATIRQPLLFKLARPVEQLGDLLLANFAGETRTMKEIFRQHNIDTRYIESNYKAALLELEKQKKIVTDPPADKRRKSTFADHVRVTFPQA